MRLPQWIIGRMADALKKITLRRNPDFVIGPNTDPYMHRWWMIPRNRFFNIYLHRIMRSDDDRALHDHPSWNVSILLSGGYVEALLVDPKDPCSDVEYRHKSVGKVIFRSATTPHRLILPMSAGDPFRKMTPLAGFPQHCWTLFIMGPRIREWGFSCPQGWRPWREFVSTENPGLPGPGCD
jgi:hypothetical protein